ncbi:outer membrane protein assembly factor BamE [Flavimaricola marinus]|uniref:SmpA / OmlA family protein n=1 Tax=Flavimaricola marinus TaxID=1819565 RepID=A0A238LJR7_9RHOB|nr:outer membrane protein assembly factor BamE [Flavimaricola marinus]SMY09635.1 SmpA / OmlA family protein [Flavimaricola marinus]
MNRRHILAQYGLHRLALVLALCVSAACTPIYRNHGYIPLEADLALLTVGVDTRESVIQAVGSPTAGGVLSESGYYYVASRFRHYGFLEPAEIEREVLAISFNAAGTVSNIERFGLEQGRVVTLSRRVTDDNIQDVTFLEQLLGNLGNIDASTLFGSDG